MSATPYLQVNTRITERNIERMADWANASNVQLRPHVKTHKSIELARLQIAAGAVGITVATVGEAEVFASAGFDDIFVAYPVWIDAELAERLNRLSETARVIVGVDSTESLNHSLPLLSEQIEWRIEIDSGHHRSGVLPDDVEPIAELLDQHSRRLDGLFSFPGHSYSPALRAQSAADEATALSAAQAKLGRGLMLSGGSSPSMEFARTNVIDEFRPGVYLFGDAQQWELGAHSPDNIALWAVGTVVSVRPGRYVTNVGSKIIGADRAAFASGFGRVLDDHEARIVLLSEHHSVIESNTVPALGSRVRIVPNHVCNAVNLVEELQSTTGKQIRVDARGHNS